MTDPVRMADPVTALRAMPPGGLLIWRLFGAAPSRYDIQALHKKARQQKCRLLLAGDARRSRHLNADGVHLPERALAQNHFKSERRRLVTAAAHSERAIFKASRAGVDAVLISPVFATESHAGAKPLGIIRFAQLARRAAALGLGVYALGGVSEVTRKRLRGVPINGIAGIDLLGRVHA